MHTIKQSDDTQPGKVKSIMAEQSDYFSREHIVSCKFNASEILAEQAIHCLELVAELARKGLSFQFKGGNSLLMLLEPPERFSIDVDIATDCTREEIESILDTIVNEFGRFSAWEKRQHKTKPWLPMSSYYLYYKSHFEPDEHGSIMLDVQLRRSPYRTQWKQVACGTLYSSVVLAEVPLSSSIIGDKLLTLGPSTLGIPLGKGKEAQRLKHVFDISRLLHTNPSIAEIKNSFLACLKQENSIQGKEIQVENVVKDTLSFCWSVVHNDGPECGASGQSSPVLNENLQGINAFAKHLFKPGYSWRDLQVDMARVALCVAAMEMEQITDLQFLDALTGKCEGRVRLNDGILSNNSYARNCWEIVSDWSNNETFL